MADQERDNDLEKICTAWRCKNRLEPEENMKRWQKGWPSYCGDICCFSKDCGSIRCSKCTRSLTSSVPSAKRYVCMQCPRPENPKDGAFYTLCKCCFDSSTVLHPHAQFIFIDRFGTHSPLPRMNGVFPEQPILLDHIQSFPWDAHTFASLSCLACFDSFSPTDPPAKPLGCQSTPTHAFACPDKTFGFVPLDGYYHRACYLQVLAHHHLFFGKFCGDSLPICCDLCLHQAQLV